MSQSALGKLYNSDRLQARLTRLFATRAILSEWGLQYGLCEVGPVALRLDPRLLEKTLSPTLTALSAPIHGLINNPDLTPVVCAAAAKEAEQAAAILKEEINGFDALRLAAIFQKTISPNAQKAVYVELEVETVRLISTFSIPVHSISGKVIVDGRVVRFWILNDLRWLYPDDPRLWRILLGGARENTPVVIAARAISQMTFPLLKAFGSRGCQFYSILTDKHPHPNVVDAAKRLDLPPILPFNALRTHPVQGILQRNLGDVLNPRTPLNAAERLLREAEQRGLGTTSESILNHLHEWAIASGQYWPPQWLAAIEYLSELPQATNPVDSAPVVSNLVKAPTSDLKAPNEMRSDSRSDAVISRSRVAAEVDTTTWNALVRKRGMKKPK